MAELPTQNDSPATQLHSPPLAFESDASVSVGSPQTFLPKVSKPGTDNNKEDKAIQDLDDDVYSFGENVQVSDRELQRKRKLSSPADTAITKKRNNTTRNMGDTTEVHEVGQEGTGGGQHLDGSGDDMVLSDDKADQEGTGDGQHLDGSCDDMVISPQNVKKLSSPADTATTKKRNNTTRNMGDTTEVHEVGQEGTGGGQHLDGSGDDMVLSDDMADQEGTGDGQHLDGRGDDMVISPPNVKKLKGSGPSSMSVVPQNDGNEEVSLFQSPNNKKTGTVVSLLDGDVNEKIFDGIFDHKIIRCTHDGNCGFQAFLMGLQYESILDETMNIQGLRKSIADYLIAHPGILYDGSTIEVPDETPPRRWSHLESSPDRLDKMVAAVYDRNTDFTQGVKKREWADHGLCAVVLAHMYRCSLVCLQKHGNEFVSQFAHYNPGPKQVVMGLHKGEEPPIPPKGWVTICRHDEVYFEFLQVTCERPEHNAASGVPESFVHHRPPSCPEMSILMTPPSEVGKPGQGTNDCSTDSVASPIRANVKESGGTEDTLPISVSPWPSRPDRATAIRIEEEGKGTRFLKKEERELLEDVLGRGVNYNKYQFTTAIWENFRKFQRMLEKGPQHFVETVRRKGESKNPIWIDRSFCDVANGGDFTSVKYVGISGTSEVEHIEEEQLKEVMQRHSYKPDLYIILDRFGFVHPDFPFPNRIMNKRYEIRKRYFNRNRQYDCEEDFPIALRTTLNADKFWKARREKLAKPELNSPSASTIRSTTSHLLPPRVVIAPAPSDHIFPRKIWSLCSPNKTLQKICLSRDEMQESSDKRLKKVERRVMRYLKLGQPVQGATPGAYFDSVFECMSRCFCGFEWKDGQPSNFHHFVQGNQVDIELLRLFSEVANSYLAVKENVESMRKSELSMMDFITVECKDEVVKKLLGAWDSLDPAVHNLDEYRQACNLPSKEDDQEKGIDTKNGFTTTVDNVLRRMLLLKGPSTVPLAFYEETRSNMKSGI